MLGVAASILGGAIVLGLAQTYLQQPAEASSKDQPMKDPAKLAEPDKNIQGSRGENFQARLWQSRTLKTAQKWSRKMK